MSSSEFWILNGQVSVRAYVPADPLLGSIEDDRCGFYMFLLSVSLNGRFVALVGFHVMREKVEKSDDECGDDNNDATHVVHDEDGDDDVVDDE